MAKLLARILRERAAGLFLVDRGVGRDELAKIVRREVDVLRDATGRLHVRERLLEALSIHAVDDLPVHLDEPAIRVEREARVAGGGREPLDRGVVQPEVEDRVHHPRHRDGGARADGDEERIAIVAEPLAGSLLERGDVLLDLVVETGGHLASASQIRTARLGRDREPVRNGHAELRHLGEADPLPAEELATAARVLAEVEDVAHLRGNLPALGMR